MNVDKIMEAVVPVVGGYKTLVDTTLECVAVVLDNMNGDTQVVEAETIVNEINGEE